VARWLAAVNFAAPLLLKSLTRAIPAGEASSAFPKFAIAATSKPAIAARLDIFHLFVRISRFPE